MMPFHKDILLVLYVEVELQRLKKKAVKAIPIMTPTGSKSKVIIVKMELMFDLIPEVNQKENDTGLAIKW